MLVENTKKYKHVLAEYYEVPEKHYFMDKNLDFGSSDLIWCTPSAVCFFNLSEAFNLHNHAFLTIFIPINYLGGGYFHIPPFRNSSLIFFLKVYQHFWKINRPKFNKSRVNSLEPLINIWGKIEGFSLFQRQNAWNCKEVKWHVVRHLK